VYLGTALPLHECGEWDMLERSDLWTGACSAVPARAT